MDPEPVTTGCVGDGVQEAVGDLDERVTPIDVGASGLEQRVTGFAHRRVDDPVHRTAPRIGPDAISNDGFGEAYQLCVLGVQVAADRRHVPIDRIQLCPDPIFVYDRRSIP
ncbi:hypothetical protein BH24ACT6_BH24ACT6_06950 [soil metagenome]